MEQTQIETWKLMAAGASALLGIVPVAIAVLKERHASRERLRDEFRFSVEVEKARAELGELSPLCEQKALNALLGRRDISPGVARYLIGRFEDPNGAIRRYVHAKARLEVVSGSSPAFRFKGCNQSPLFRSAGKVGAFLAYIVFYGFGVSPLLLGAFEKIGKPLALEALLITFPVGLLMAVLALVWGGSIIHAEKLMELQTEMQAGGALPSSVDAPSAERPAPHPAPAPP